MEMAAAPLFALWAKWVIIFSVGYGSVPWRKWGVDALDIMRLRKMVPRTFRGVSSA